MKFSAKAGAAGIAAAQNRRDSGGLKTCSSWNRSNRIVGSFGIESRSAGDTELRRMYLDRDYRGRGIAQRMLDYAQTQARALGFSKLLVSTAEIQKAADKFYRRNGFLLLRTEVAETMTAKQAGGGLTRFHFEKAL